MPPFEQSTQVLGLPRLTLLNALMASTSETQSSTFRDTDPLSQADVALEKARSNERITANIPDSF